MSRRVGARRLDPSLVRAKTALRELERIRVRFGPEPAARKRALLRHLGRASLATAREVGRLHEVASFIHVWPDNEGVRAAARTLLDRFARRADLRRHAEALAGSGIAGTAMDFSFFAPTARWLATRWPRSLTIDWASFDHADGLESLLPLLAHPAETPALDEYALPVREWIDRMKGPRETDATFLARRFGQLAMPDAARELLYDQLDVPLTLTPGPRTPSRTLDRWPGGVTHVVAVPPSTGRPDLASELRRPPRLISAVSVREGGRLIDLARAAMVARNRDLDVFAYGDPRDVRVVDAGDGLQFAVIGAIPERRLLLESVYGFLTLRNQVPVGYVLVSALFGSSEIAYNVFDTYRGLGAATVYARVLATTRALFGADAFTIFPYQLGDGNDEALESGAWWFYAKLGFRPHDRAALRKWRRERDRMRRNPEHRSSLATLRSLATSNLYWHLGAPRRDVIGRIELPEIGLKVTRFLAGRYGSDRTGAASACVAEARARLGVRALSGWGRGERQAFERWAPLVLLLPGLSGWTAAERRALTAVIRAKGGRRESEFVRLFDGHSKLRRGLLALTSA